MSVDLRDSCTSCVARSPNWRESAEAMRPSPPWVDSVKKVHNRGNRLMQIWICNSHTDSDIVLYILDESFNAP